MELQEFITKARAKHLTNDAIREKLLLAGWEASAISAALDDDDLVAPKPPAQSQTTDTKPHAEPVAVVENLSVRGFEYRILFVLIFITVASIIGIANVLLSQYQSAELAFPLTLLLVGGPLGAFLFLRLRKAEQAEPQLRRDPSRRKMIQAIELVAFLAVLIHTITLLYLLISGHYTSAGHSYYSDYSSYSDGYNQPSFFNDFLRWIITMVVAGGTFAYYWIDEHRSASSITN